MDTNKETSRPRASSSSESKKNPASESVSYYVDQLAMALGQMIPPERTVLYIRALSDLTEKQLAHGFGQALKLFKPEFGKTFPAPAEIREWSEQHRSVDPIAETRKMLERSDKPPDWQELGRKIGITAEETARWLEDGKAKQREHIAKTKADPEWRRLAARFGVPGVSTREPGDER